jgi:hypothetical protein
METVISPRNCGSTLAIDPPATLRSTAGASHTRSGMCCCRYTLIPPKNTRSPLTLASSVRVGV